MTDDDLPPAASAVLGCEAMLRLILRDCCDQIDQQMVVFLESEALSGPHKLRVALRRLTTALDAFHGIIRRKALEALRAEAKAIFRALGKVRDADVFLQASDDEDAETTSVLQLETQELRRRIRRDLRAARAVGFAPTVLRRMNSDRFFKRSDDGRAARARPVGALARQELAALWAGALAHGPDLAAMSPEDRHEFRKDMKGLRYLSEFFAPFWSPEAWLDYRNHLQELQDALGVLNDLANARARGREGMEGREAEALARAGQLWDVLRAQPGFWAGAFVAGTESAAEAPPEAPPAVAEADLAVPTLAD